MIYRCLIRQYILVVFFSIYIFGISPSQPVLAGSFPEAQHAISLDVRDKNGSVNNIFKNNILLTLAYMSGLVQDKSEINWQDLNKPFHYDYVLRPGEIFAFHEDILTQYSNKRVYTTNVHFNSAEGFLSDGYLYGDGVCHLASLINWVAYDAGLFVLAPTDHKFREIPEIPQKFGVSIYSSPSAKENNKKQNLYIENKFGKPVLFAFNYEDGVLNLSINKYGD